MEENKSSVHLQDQKELSLTGVKEVLRFDETAAEFSTTVGLLQVTGDALHMERLDPDSGQVILTGRLISLYYPQDTSVEKGGLFSRWLK